jgi:hypothetical protein
MSASEGTMPGHPSQFSISQPGEADPVCVVNWVEKDDHHEFQLRIDEANVAIRDQLTDLIHAAIGPPLGRAPTLEEASEIWSRVRQGITNAGFCVSEMSGGDVRLELAFDLNTGRAVGRSVALHPLAQVDPDLGESMTAAIRHAFDNEVKTMVANMERATTSGMHTDAARALLDGMQSNLIIAHQHAPALHAAALRIDVDRLGPSLQLEILKLRSVLAAAADQYDTLLHGACQ